MTPDAAKSRKEMTPERWERIREVVYTALEQEPSQRRRYLDQTCGEDSELRSQVESYLSKTESSERAIPSDVLPSILLSPGRRIDHFEIISFVGAGGMGEVYRARDPQLRREVAIKILPPRFTHDPDRLRRFEQEACAAAALNHPNILAVYQFGTHEGCSYLVSELLEGETLRDQLCRGSLPVRKSMAYAVQIARGLAAAHAKGIVHRDLKPENLFITTDGQIKILDFGLAKLRHYLISDLTSSAETHPGVVLGTVGYMAPEQVRGDSVDHRADIFAFGAILFEMITGERAFQGDGSIEVMSAILLADPLNTRAAGRRMTRPLHAVIQRCLAKQPAERFQSAQDLADRLQLLSVRTSILTYQLATWWFRLHRHRSKAIIFAALAGILTAVTTFRLATRVEYPSWNSKEVLLTANLGDTRVLAPVISRDGNYLAYVDPHGLTVVAIKSLETRVLRTEPGWSLEDWVADGTQLLASKRENGHIGLWAVSTLTGNKKFLGQDAATARVSPDGSLIAFGATVPRSFKFGPTDASSSLSSLHAGTLLLSTVTGSDEVRVMSVNGENPRAVARVEAPDNLSTISWAPDNKHFATIHERLVDGHRSPRIEIRNIEDNTVAPVISDLRLFGRNGETGAVWLNDGTLVFLMPDYPPNNNNDNLWQVPIDLPTGRMRGQPQQITNWAGLALAYLSASHDGRRLAFAGIHMLDTVYVATLKSGRTATISNVRRLTNDNWNNWATAWSGNESVLYKSERRGNWELFRQNVNQLTSEAVPSGSESYAWADLSPDGSWILADVYKPWPAIKGLVRIPVVGGKPAPVLSSSSLKHKCAAPPSRVCVLAEYDDQEIKFSLFDPIKGRGEGLFNLTLDAIPATPDYKWALSPDGKEIARATCRNTIEVIDVGTKSARQLLLTNGWYITAVSWMADPQHLLVTMIIDEATMSSGIFSVDLMGKMQLLYETKGGALYSPIASPDGGKIAFTKRIMENHAAMIERF